MCAATARAKKKGEKKQNKKMPWVAATTASFPINPNGETEGSGSVLRIVIFTKSVEECCLKGLPFLEHERSLVCCYGLQ